jgi:hypothetical protein
MQFLLSVLFIFVFSPLIFSQSDSTLIKKYRDKFILYNDLGFTTAPFDITFKNKQNTNQTLNYRNNLRTSYGLGCHYQWLSLHILAQLPGSIRSVEKYGKSIYFHLGGDFTIKNTFSDLDLYYYKGYAIKHYLSATSSNYILPNLEALNISLNAWYFFNDNFKMGAVRGRNSIFNKNVHTWYIKTTLNSFSISNPDNVIPTLFTDPTSTKTNAEKYQSFDLGVLPGFAFSNTYNHWKYSLLSGFGFVVQEKGYQSGEINRKFIGLAPRLDLKIIGGYNTNKNFIMLYSEFDNKSISIPDLKLNQIYYTIRLVYGYRFDKKSKL